MPPPPPPAPDLLGGAFSSLKTNVFDKFARAAPPNVDTSAASTSLMIEDSIVTLLTKSQIETT